MKKTLFGLVLTVVQLLILWIATPAFARSISFEGAGTALWIFIILGAVIVLMQLIPAAILFFSFIGTTVAMSKKKQEDVVIGAETEKVAI